MKNNATTTVEMKNAYMKMGDMSIKMMITIRTITENTMTTRMNMMRITMMKMNSMEKRVKVIRNTVPDKRVTGYQFKVLYYQLSSA